MTTGTRRQTFKAGRVMRHCRIDSTAARASTRDADRALRERIETAVANFVATLSPQERVTFAQSLKLRGQWREPKPPAQVQRPPDEASAAR